MLRSSLDMKSEDPAEAVAVVAAVVVVVVEAVGADTHGVVELPQY
jgi:hypothetical protein